MYKVFFNEYLLEFASEFKNSSKDNIHQIIDIQGFDDFVDFLGQIEAGKYVTKLKIRIRMKEELLKQLPFSLEQLPAAGGLVKNQHGQLLFIKRFGRWDLPKGKIDKKEKTEDAAVREVQEECGIQQLKLIRQLPSTFHIYRSPYLDPDRNLVWKETFWFEMIHAGDGQVHPQEEEGIEEVRWFDRDDLNEVFESTYGNLRELLHAYLA